MTDQHAQRGIDFDQPNAARVYDYLIGGKLNYAIDRMFADKILAVRPESKDLALMNRKWLRRAVRFGAEQGIRQFLDIGSGMPTVGHVHEVVQAIDPKSRVVYVDNEPVAVAHSEIVLQDVENAVMVQADAEYPERVLEHDTTEMMLDFDQPVMLIMAAFVHFIPDERDPAGLVAAYRDALAPGSYLAMSSGTFEGQGEEVRRAAELYQKNGTNVVARSRDELQALLGGFELVEPGIVFTPQWRPDDPGEVGEHPELASQLALVARKA
ncbi:SAM-dependent methyltransferase [Amycolatopsis sp., V23-08]|uniref:SAM-dependent methyltransferase n=1 Tax=Amycolatopsis heterodermiae TaxID=3110235 RepID=A0ABU5QWQ3_9PSEU|nr:SAM-dependent methyltransferase [Amycolatopsis sp., V23-08]MEA5358350.1 SAM-dependent methyltransferase [Amycolatopsis sp., V23-08]